MTATPIDLDTLRPLLAAHGLILRGGFHPGPADRVPPLPDGRAARSVVLVGNAGPAMWQHFAASAETATTPAPLDDWTRRVVTPIAQATGAGVLFPFDGPPHLPFTRWARRAEPVHVSPLRILIHPRFGLWHAYRAALVFAAVLALPPVPSTPSPCARCRSRPCLTACPVGAFGDAGYDVPACIGHVRSAAGFDCRDRGCRARRACPIGAEYRHAEAQARFHMRAFLAARGEPMP